MPALVVRLGVCVRIAACPEPQVGVVPTDPLEGKRDLVPCAVGHAARPDHEHSLGLVASIDVGPPSLNPCGKDLDCQIAGWIQTARDHGVEREEIKA